MADLKMPEINSVTIAGNLTRDPVFRTTANGNMLVHFTIASNKRYRDKNDQWKEDVCFVGVIARNRLAESCQQGLKKGSGVLVEGELQSRDWKTDDVNSRRIIEIRARRIQFLNRSTVKQQDEDSNFASESDEINNDTSDIPEDLNSVEEPDSTKASEQNEDKQEKPLSFEDDSYNKFISNEESEFLKGDTPDK